MREKREYSVKTVRESTTCEKQLCHEHHLKFTICVTWEISGHHHQVSRFSWLAGRNDAPYLRRQGATGRHALKACSIVALCCAKATASLCAARRRPLTRYKVPMRTTHDSDHASNVSNGMSAPTRNGINRAKVVALFDSSSHRSTSATDAPWPPAPAHPRHPWANGICPARNAGNAARSRSCPSAGS